MLANFKWSVQFVLSSVTSLIVFLSTRISSQLYFAVIYLFVYCFLMCELVEPGIGSQVCMGVGGETWFISTGGGQKSAVGVSLVALHLVA